MTRDEAAPRSGGIARTDARVSRLNPATGGLGWEPEDPPGGSILDSMSPTDRTAWLEARDEIIDHPDRAAGVSFRLRDREGDDHILESRLTNLLSVPSVQGLLAIARDVTRQREAEMRLSRFLTRAPIAVWTVRSLSSRSNGRAGSGRCDWGR